MYDELIEEFEAWPTTKEMWDKFRLTIFSWYCHEPPKVYFCTHTPELYVCFHALVSNYLANWIVDMGASKQISGIKTTL